MEHPEEWFECPSDAVWCLDDLWEMMHGDHDDHDDWDYENGDFDYDIDCEAGDPMCEAMMNFPEWNCTDGSMECPPPLYLMEEWYCPGNSENQYCLEAMIAAW